MPHALSHSSSIISNENWRWTGGVLEVAPSRWGAGMWFSGPGSGCPIDEGGGNGSPGCHPAGGGGNGSPPSAVKELAAPLLVASPVGRESAANELAESMCCCGACNGERGGG